MIPRDTIDPAGQWIWFVAADDQPACLLAHVHQIVRISQAGRVTRKDIAGDSFEGDMLVIHRSGGKVEARHGSHARPPDTGGIDHDLGINGTSFR